MLKKIKRKIRRELCRITRKFFDISHITGIENELFHLYQQNIELERQIRNLNGERKISVVFICYEPESWDSLKTVCEACMCDNAFDVTIVTIPLIKQMSERKGNEHSIYEASGAEEYFRNYPCRVINGFDNDTKKWFDLKTLEPDYLFFQDPYDVHRPEEYQIKEVSRYTHVCFIHYGCSVIGGELFHAVHPYSFLEKVSYIFSENMEKQHYYESMLQSSHNKGQKILNLGFPRWDNFNEKMLCTNLFWKHDRGERTRIIWLPRWNTTEKNCNFFDYKDRLFEFVESSEIFELLFRPHPLTFANFMATGEMSEQEVGELQEKYRSADNCAIDGDGDFWKAFATTDIIMADATSLLADAFLTEKPIIYCHKEKDSWSEFAEHLYEGFYVANCWDDVQRILKQLQSGDDPLLETRRKIIREHYRIPKEGSGVLIKEYLKEEYKK